MIAIHLKVRTNIHAYGKEPSIGGVHSIKERELLICAEVVSSSEIRSLIGGVHSIKEKELLICVELVSSSEMILTLHQLYQMTRCRIIVAS